MSPDPLRGSILNPQSLNRYAYVGNNPTNFADPLGLIRCPAATMGCSIDDVGGGGCSLDGVAASCGYVSLLANAGALAGVSSPLPSGPGSPLMIWLSGGSISYRDHGGDGVDPSSGLLTSFNGEWVTLDQYQGYLEQYAERIATLSYDQRLRAVARGVVAGAGGLDDWRVIAGFYAASLLFASPGALASLDTATVAVGYGESAGSPLIHAAVGADGEWISAWGGFGNMTMEVEGSAAWVRAYSWFQFSVPVLNTEAVLGTAGATVSTCLSGVCQAIWNGWFH